MSRTILVHDLEADLSAKLNQNADPFVGCAYGLLLALLTCKTSGRKKRCACFNQVV